MGQNQQGLLDLFIVVAGAIISFQFIHILSSIKPISFTGLGILREDMVLAFLLFIIVLSLALVLTTMLSLIPQLLPKLDRSRFHLLLLVAGAEIAVLGLSLIYLSSSVVSGTSTSIMPIGIEMFSLGMISMALFVESMGSSRAVKKLPNYSYLLFFLLLLPAAFLIAD